jgi:hypothetical protein
LSSMMAQVLLGLCFRASLMLSTVWPWV